MATLFKRTTGDDSEQPDRVPQASTPATTQASAPATTIEEVVARRQIRIEFQPIVDVASGEVVAYEALTRGPAGTPLESPAALFARAQDAGLGGELDTIAHATAFRLALEADLHPSTSIFINAHPDSVGRQIPADLASSVVRAQGRLRVFLDISEKAMGTDPAATLSAIRRARASGWGISLDNVGLTADSLALMPFAGPDIVKIDVSLLHEHAHAHAPRILGAVTAHSHRTGATTLAAGVETDDHRRTARALGATFAQGYHFGRPGPLPSRAHAPVNPIPLIATQPSIADDDTPFQLAAAQYDPVPATRVVLEALAAELEQRAVLDPDPPVVLACLPEARLMSGGPLAFLQVLARSASYVGALCGEPPHHPLAAVHLVELGADDPLRNEQTIIVLGPHYSALLTARNGGTAEGGSAYRLVYDRNLVVRAARVLIERITSA
ncbi:MAG TPA: EAL domain-containing protein [Actinoplanes sp.]|nr:EAL domain-containing protein [Actinoplanes sp.]